MAVKYAITNGNWSDTSTWNGGTLPDVDDDVYTNGYNVAFDQDIHINMLTNNTCPDTGNEGGCLYFPNSGTFNIIADIYAGISEYVIRYSPYSSIHDQRLNVIGDVYASNSHDAIMIISSDICYCNVTGNIYASDNNCAIYLRATNSSRNTFFNLIGNAYSSASQPVLRLEVGPSYVTVIGSLISGGEYVLRADVFNLTGYAKASATNSAVYDWTGYVTQIANVSGILENYGSKMAISGFRDMYFEPADNIAWKFYDSDDNEKTLYDVTANEDFPSEGDVRDGVEYGGGAFKGISIIPPPESVAAGVPTDDTVGTAVITVADMGALLASYNPAP